MSHILKFLCIKFNLRLKIPGVMNLDDSSDDTIMLPDNKCGRGSLSEVRHRGDYVCGLSVYFSACQCKISRNWLDGWI